VKAGEILGGESNVIRSLGRYQLLEQVGSGGMAVVYRGRDSALDREVAVKLLHPHLAQAAESRVRFSREARAVARLAHPGIVEIYDYSGDGAPEAYLVTEFIRGQTLRSFAQSTGFADPEIGMLIGRALADALAHAHAAGVIHRDLKPENVMVELGARPAMKLTDFGIARILASDERMTMTGALVGSPNHMAPEIVEGKDADERSDIFSLGTILYWLATGHLPFAASNPTATLRRAITGEFDDPRTVSARVSGPLAALLTRCLAPEPANRPGSAAEVRATLDELLAEVGLDRPEEELARYLSDPPAYQAAFPARAVAALVPQGEAAMRRRQTALALTFFDRVLAIEPGNALVAARLRSLSQRRRWRRSAWSAAGLLAAGAVAIAGARWWSGRPVAAAPATSPGLAEAPPAPVGEPPVRDRQGPEREPGSAGATPARPVRPRAAAPGAGEPLTELVVHVRPYAQRALLDGVEVPSGDQLVRFGLSAGRPHTIRIEHACCLPFQRELSAQEAADLGELRVPLEPRPARLRVEGNPATRVLLDGRLVGTAGDSQRLPLPVPVPSGGETPYEASARIVLEPPDGPTRTVVVRLRAGVELVIAAPTAEGTP
jgi:tRNA A-37 threonylcarbamoyl transferase component Bud32